MVTSQERRDRVHAVRDDLARALPEWRAWCHVHPAGTPQTPVDLALFHKQQGVLLLSVLTGQWSFGEVVRIQDGRLSDSRTAIQAVHTDSRGLSSVVDGDPLATPLSWKNTVEKEIKAANTNNAIVTRRIPVTLAYWFVDMTQSPLRSHDGASMTSYTGTPHLASQIDAVRQAWSATPRSNSGPLQHPLGTRRINILLAAFSSLCSPVMQWAKS